MESFIKKILNIIMRKKGEVYYINGPETLPPPLSAEKEAELVNSKDYEESAKKTLVEHNLRLVVYIAKKFESTGLCLEDLISIGTIGLIKAVNTFKADKNIKLATYASRCIENEILMYMRKTVNQKCEVSIDEPINIDWDGNELHLSEILGCDADDIFKGIENDEDRKIIYNAVGGLNERDRKIIYMRFGLCGVKEKTQKEVADEMGISQSYISRLEKRIIEKLRREIGGA